MHPGTRWGKALVVERGSVDQSFPESARVFEGTFRTQIHAPVGMETRAALAEWQGESLTVWKTSRAVHANDRQTLARVLGIPPAQVRVICTNMGGGFGNKDESRLAVLVALAARQAGHPVRLEYNLLRGETDSRRSPTCVSACRDGPRRLSPCAAS